MLLAAALASVPSGDAAPIVSTFAGSGVPGSVDGAAANATFTMPAGVAVDARGRVYVADAGGNAIRVIADGRVRTLAGDGVAGYADGRGTAARFALPLGIAVSANGTVYVADGNNHVVRRIAPDGTVSTLAGSATASGVADGPGAAARFIRPTQLALEPNGALLVSDPLSGLRRVAPNGDVSTIPLGETPTDHPYGVAVASGSAGETIFVADAKGLLVFRPDGTRQRFFAPDDRATASLEPGTNDASGVITEGRETIAFPYAIVAADDRHVFYTDIRTDTVRLLNVLTHAARMVAGPNIVDGSGDDAGFADGPGAAARFDAPFGIARASDGSLYVADGANRRIRRIADPGPGRENLIAGIDELLPADGTPGSERTIVTGNSISWDHTRWSDSIEGILERDLRSRDPRARVMVVTAPGTPTIAAFASYLDELADAGAVRRAVLLVSTINVMGEFNYPSPFQIVPAEKTWRGPFIASLRRLDASLRSHGVELVVVPLPTSFELSPDEDAWEVFHIFPEIRSYAGAGRMVRDAVVASGVRTADAWPAFLAAESAPVHAALYGTADAHLTRAGRAVVAGVIANALR
ncbi:MAG TPA: hypothetical protein VFB22_16340 [Candidatus Baltobacteraceae bacterium]|nr:hypothetical protein [Candidatus Baltobacteraceae bacterium]